MGDSTIGSASGFEPEGYRFESYSPSHVSVTQWIECQPSKLEVIGSNPIGNVMADYLSGRKGQSAKLLDNIPHWFESNIGLLITKNYEPYNVRSNNIHN